MSFITNMADSLRNFVANMGTGRDKASHSHYFFNPLTEQELTAAYRGSWLPRKIVDIPADDACRQWRNWVAQRPQIEKIEAEEIRLGVRLKTRAARRKARLYGGAAILIGNGDTDPSQPLRAERMGRGGIRYLTVLNKSQVTVSEIENDPASDQFGKPKMYRLANSQVDVHPSRLVVFVGNELPDDTQSASNESGWGDSVLQAVIKQLKNTDSTIANIASLVFEANVDIVRIPGFMEGMQRAEYRAKVSERFSLAATMKGNNGMFVMDEKEQYERKQVSFANMPEVMDRFMQISSGAADIPITRLFNESTGGLGGNGEENTRNYYDRIKADQELEMSPAMALLDECLIRSALGNRPPEIHYKWASLWQPTAVTRSEIAKRNAETAKIIKDMGVIPDDAFTKAFVTSLVESGDMPGIEGAMAEYEAAHVNDDPTADPVITDAAPMTLYVSRKVINRADFEAWAKTEGLTLQDDLHVTIAFSRTPVDWMSMGSAWSSAELDAGTGGARQMDSLGTDGSYKALLFNCSELSWRHEDMRAKGASWDWEGYQAHITIIQDPDLDLSGVTPYRGKILLGPEIFEEIKE